MTTMMWVYIVVLCLINVAGVSGKCSITADWLDFTMEERLSLADIVVYGRTKEHRASSRIINGRNSYSINDIFEVYCVIKRNEDPIEETIIIEGIAPRDGCSGTTAHMQLDNEAIVALKPTYGGKYVYHEVMPMLSATFAGVKSNLESVSAICGLQEWMPPQGAIVNRCPICGTANFTDNAINLDTLASADRLPCFENGVFNGNLSDCKLNSETTSADQRCLNKKFGRTCARLTMVTPNVGCQCTNLQFGDTSGPLGEIDTASTSLPSLCTILISVLVACFGLYSGAW